MQDLMSTIKRNLRAVAEARTRTGVPLVLSALERAYLAKHRPIEALSLPWFDKVPDGWCCIAEKLIEAGDWPALLDDVSEKQGLAFHQSSALWWRVGVYERTNPRTPRTGHDAFAPMAHPLKGCFKLGEPFEEPDDIFADRHRAARLAYDALVLVLLDASVEAEPLPLTTLRKVIDARDALLASGVVSNDT